MRALVMTSVVLRRVRNCLRIIIIIIIIINPVVFSSFAKELSHKALLSTAFNRVQILQQKNISESYFFKLNFSLLIRNFLASS